MSEPKDPAIKLFGKTIPVAEPPAVSGGAPEASSSSSATVLVEDNSNNIVHKSNNNSDGMDRDEGNSNKNGEEDDTDDVDGGGDENNGDDKKDVKGETPTETKKEDGGQTVSSKEVRSSDSASGVSDNPKTSSVEENATPKVSKTEEDQSEGSNSQEKTLKKPDKILPCPRCNSMDTKFCYYNNYNVNQPRHFCKNCQRYWTAGGTMRNVPVGAGRRKNKNSASQYRHITVSEALQNARADVPTTVHAHLPSLKPNGTVLTFGSDAPLCESMASVLNLADKTMRNCTPKGFHKPEEIRIPLPYGGGGAENGETSVNGSLVTTTNPKDEACKFGSQEQVMPNCQSFPPQIPVFPGAPWPYPWNSAQWSPPVPLPAFCPPGFPMPFYPAAAYWGCAVPGTWNIPWLPQPSSPTATGTSSGPNSPTLGKHSRDENTLKPSFSAEEQTPKESNSERSLWIPKTLRIDDPGEAARSSIWATLGIKNDKPDSIAGGGLFKSFQQKNDARNSIAETSKVLQANPAALSRSVSFQESS